jgi:hypothetical protein
MTRLEFIARNVDYSRNGYHNQYGYSPLEVAALITNAWHAAQAQALADAASNAVALNADDGMPWCDHCQCYHYATADCLPKPARIRPEND